MADEVPTTPIPITLTALAKQPLAQAIEVSDIDRIDAVLTILALTGTNVTIRLISGMQKETESGWVEVATFTLQGAVGSSFAITTGLLKYVRWELVNATGLGSVTFFIQGMGRTF